MACDGWKERLLAHLYGEDAEGDRERVLEHLDACPSCRHALDELGAARGLLRGGESPVPATPRLVLLPRGARVRPAVLPFAAGFAAAALLGMGVAAGWVLRGTPTETAGGTGTGLTASDRRAVEQLIEAHLSRRDTPAPVQQVRDDRGPETTTHPGLDRDEVASLLAAAEQRFEQRRAADVRYVLGEISAAELRTGASIGETQRALQYVALANNPSASLH